MEPRMITKSRMVVIEGPDGAGKTTLAKRLQDQYGFSYQHEGPPPKGADPLIYYRERLFDAAMEAVAGQGVVLDRFALGERVYGPLLRGKDNLGNEGWATIRKCLDGIGAVRVLCLPDREVCLESWESRRRANGELISDLYVFEATYRLWEQFRNDPGQLIYDWTLHGDLHWHDLTRVIEGQ